MAGVVIRNLVGGKNGPTKNWTKNLTEILAPLLLSIDELVFRTTSTTSSSLESNPMQ
jgi:hypothetical protein